MKDCDIGLGLRPDHYQHILENTDLNVRWFEAISENYMSTAGRPLAILEKIRSRYPIALHGVSMSLGSADPINPEYLKRLKNLINRIHPCRVSDHLCWTGVPHSNIHDLLPLPYTQEVIDHVVSKITRVQDQLQRSILIENVSSYVTYKHSEMTEWEFLNEITTRSGCQLLLDVNNVYVSAKNHNFDPKTFLDAIPADKVGQMHLAGFTDMGTHLFDTHSKPVYPEVWTLFEHVIQRMPDVAVMVEWDDDIPEYSVVEAEILKAQQIWREWHGSGPVAKKVC